MPTTSPLEIVQMFTQNVLSLTPVIVLGSGASAAHGVPGMGPLAKELCKQLAPTDWDTTEHAQWTEFCKLIDSGIDLETALGKVRLSDMQTEFVVETTRKYLLPSDLKAFSAMLANRQTFALTRLYKNLFTSTHSTIDIVTTNYDRLAEYAADAGGFSHFTGSSMAIFRPAHHRLLPWSDAMRALFSDE